MKEWSEHWRGSGYTPRNMPLADGNMAIWHIDYFESQAIEK